MISARDIFPFIYFENSRPESGYADSVKYFYDPSIAGNRRVTSISHDSRRILRSRKDFSCSGSSFIRIPQNMDFLFLPLHFFGLFCVFKFRAPFTPLFSETVRLENDTYPPFEKRYISAFRYQSEYKFSDQASSYTAARSRIIILLRICE